MFPRLNEIYSFRKKYPLSKQIGIEIEMEGTLLSLTEGKYWRQTGDGSLRGKESIEYVLKEPCNKDYVTDRIENLLTETEKRFEGKHQNNAQFTPSDRCGVHIHINVQNMIFTECFNFIFLYLLLEKILVGYCGKSREGNLFCLRAGDAEHFIDRMIACKEQSNLSLLDRKPETDEQHTLRYASINPQAIFKFGSVEFRALRTPKNLLDIVEWINILYQIRDRSFQFENPMHFVEHYSMLGENIFFDEIMGEYAPILRRKVSDVPQKLLDGIRLTQDIAYASTIIYPTTLKDIRKKKVR